MHIVSTLFCLGGLLFSIAGFVSVRKGGSVVPFIPVGMMFMGIGMMFLIIANTQ